MLNDSSFWDASLNSSFFLQVLQCSVDSNIEYLLDINLIGASESISKLRHGIDSQSGLKNDSSKKLFLLSWEYIY